MQVNNPTLNALQQMISLNSTKLKSDGLTVGQQILAKVVSANSQGSATLHINNTILNARTTLPLTQGQTLQLIVSQLGKEIVLTPTPKAMEQTVINHAMRQNLPHEKPLREVIQSLKQIIRPTQGQSTPLPAPVTTAVRQFLQNLPSSKDVTNSEGLKKALREAGTFLENNLRQIASGKSDNNLGNDLKAMLLRLREQISQASRQGGETRTSATANTSATNTSQQTAATTSSQRSQTSPPTPTPQSSPTSTATQTATAASTQRATVTQANTASTTTAQTAENTGTSKQATTATPRNTTTSANNTATQTTAANRAQQPAASTATPAAKNIATPQTTTPTQPRPTIQGSLTLPQGAGSSEKSPATPGAPVADYGSGKREAAISARAPEIIMQRADQTMNSTSFLQNMQDKISELFRQIESALARTQLHQLNTLNELENGKLAWSLELPIRNEEDDVDVMKMRIFGDEENKNEEGVTPLTVTLEIDLKYIGPVFSKIVLLRDAVSVGFWAEEEMTYSLFEQHVEELQTRLQDAGLRTDQISCHHGRGPATPDPVPQQSGLLDLKA